MDRNSSILASAVRTIPLPDWLAGEGWIHAARIRYDPGETYDLHDHSFHELFWIEEGTAVHVLASGRVELPAGSLVYLQPGDAHGFATQGPAGFTMVNVTVRSSLVTALEQRWAGLVDKWPWSASGRSLIRQLGGRTAARLQEWADDLLHDASQLSAETFLLDLLRMTSANRPLVLVGGLPAWLQRALGCLDDPLVLAGGVAAFVVATGRSVDQVNRAVRAHLGKTTRDLVTERRLALAERRLRATNEPILAIAGDCGYASLSHFYRAFTARYGSTPKSVRKMAQAPPVTNGCECEPYSGCSAHHS